MTDLDPGAADRVRPVGLVRTLSSAWGALAVAVILLWSLVYWQRAHAPPSRLHDFVQGWTSARNHLEGEPVYRPMHESVAEYVGPEYVPFLQEVTLNAHPPATVALTLPFASMPYHDAYTAWTMWTILPLGLAVLLLFVDGGLPWTPVGVLSLVAVLLSSAALAQQTLQGQLNAILLLLLVAGWRLDRGGRSFSGGLCIGVAGAVKLFPCFVGLYFLSRRDWKGVTGTVVGFAALNAFAAFVLGGTSFVDYVTVVLPHLQRFRDQWLNVSVNGWLCRLLDAPSGSVETLFDAPVAAKALWLVTVAVLVVVCARTSSRARSRGERDAAYSLCILAAILASPVAWNHYLLLLMLPLAVGFARSQWRGRVLLGALTIVLVTIEPMWIWKATLPGPELRLADDPTPASSLQVLTILSYPTYALFALFGYTLSLVRMDGDSADSAPAEMPNGR